MDFTTGHDDDIDHLINEENLSTKNNNNNNISSNNYSPVSISTSPFVDSPNHNNNALLPPHLSPPPQSSAANHNAPPPPPPSIEPVTPPPCSNPPDNNKNKKNKNIKDNNIFDSSPPSTPDHVSSYHFDNTHTPTDSVFDAFAPGPTKFMLAPPKFRKFTQDFKTTAHVRRLDFPCSTNSTVIRDTNHNNNHDDPSPIIIKTTTTLFSDEEQRLFESLYTIILDAILYEQTKDEEEEPVAKLSPTQFSQDVSDDGIRTPKSRPRLNDGVAAETCPGAPLKSKRQYKNNIDMELCRKLEF